MNKKTALISRIACIAFLLYFVYRLILGVKTGQHVPMPLIGCALMVLVGLFRIFTIRKDFQGSEEDRKKFSKIVIRSVILALIIVAVFVTVVVLVKVNSSDNEIHSLNSVSVYVEQKGDDYAEDRLVYLITNSFKKDDLHKAWGAPADKILNADTDSDVWLLSEKHQLVIYYDKNEEVTKIEILTVTAFD